VTRDAARDAVDAYLASLEGDARTLADGEWGLSLPEVGGRPLHIGIALRDGLLRVQAEVLWPGAVDAHDLLFWNRSLRLVRFAHSGSGEVWLMAELPYAGVNGAELDRTLGILVRAAGQVRDGVA
jgi:hypothetical protein